MEAGRRIARKGNIHHWTTLIDAAPPRVRVRYLERGANLMCDYSLHAMASRPAKVGETLVTTTFPRTSTRGFAAEGEPGVAVCLLPGTELAFEQDVKYDQGWILTRTASFRVAKF